jgi:predicted transcriptional regulator
MQDHPPDLGDLEREAMSIVWDHGPISADAVREKLAKPLKESTVRTVLRRLEEKGFLTHETDGRTYIFRAAARRQHVAARAVRRVVDWFCNGSMDEVLVGMVDSKMIDRRQLEMLMARIDAAKIDAARKEKG